MKSVLIAIMSCICVSVGAQEKFSKYTSSYFQKDFYTAIVEEEKDDTVEYYVDCYSLDDLSKETKLFLKEKDVADFKEFVASLKASYQKWTATAKANKVTELEKIVEYKPLTFTSAFIYGKWNFDFDTKLKAYYKIVNNKYVMVISSGELQSSANQYIKSDGFLIALSSDKEFDDLIAAVDVEKARKFFKDKKAKQDLFKD